MCGIVGYIGHRQACDILLNGLNRLEYRGYDSAGVALVNGTVNVSNSAPLAGTQSIAYSQTTAPLADGHPTSLWMSGENSTARSTACVGG
jgi:asparagine synthetase B (glutamine-hydrolysing)